MSFGPVAGVGCHGFGLRNPLRLAPEHETKIIRGTPFRIPSIVPGVAPSQKRPDIGVTA